LIIQRRRKTKSNSRELSSVLRRDSDNSTEFISNADARETGSNDSLDTEGMAGGDWVRYGERGGKEEEKWDGRDGSRRR